MKSAKPSWLKKWLYEGVAEMEGPHEPEGRHKKHSWWQVMCLTGVDYFSTLGYQPGIAFLAAGAIAPFATLVLVLLTLIGALPMYKRVAEESPHGDGSLSMLENLLSRWKGKMFVLILLGFVATSFIITITLSAADATAHIIENPFVHEHLKFLDHAVIVTLVLIGLLGLVFLRGFNEAIGIAVGIVAIFLLLNVVTIGRGIYEIFWIHPEAFSNWQQAVWQTPSVGGSILWLALASLLVFPKLALGLSGFETGVVVMPLVKSDVKLDPEQKKHIKNAFSEAEIGDEEQRYIEGRIRNGKKLLSGAAVIMSIMLVGSSIITTMLIPAEKFQHGGEAYGRALSYLAHNLMGAEFGTAYDISTILILWFAGSSAMAGLLNIVPRYLPRYGMAPDWARAVRPLVLVFTVVCFLVTILFQADVSAQGGAYATGILALMTSASLAVTISARRKRSSSWLFYALITLIFVFTIIVNIVEQPSGLQIALLFILGIILTSFISRAMRSTEIRIDQIELDSVAQGFIDELNDEGELRIVTNRRETGDVTEYRFKEHEKRVDNHIPSSDPVIFYEIEPGDSSEFKGKLYIRGVDVEGYKILRTQAPAVPNAIAAFLLYLRDKTGKIPHVYFGWSEGNPIMYLARYILFGEGDTAPVTREILRQAEEDPELRPSVHVGG
ncbi:MAG TPA: hypothetical protein PKA82_05185 [Pyrinomonadaceae bacterium]|nr:hypothetical protein [Pyrinomonadaceae bacterium]